MTVIISASPGDRAADGAPVDISALTVDRGTPRATFLASARASTVTAQEAPGATQGDVSPQAAALQALRATLDAARAAQRQAEESDAGQDAVAAARQRVALAAQALADAQLRQAQQAGGSGGSIDTYA